MTKQYQPMKAGRELDALVAEKVMGWKLVPYAAYCNTETAIQNGWYVWVDDKGDEIAGQLEENAFSTDIVAAWLVIKQVERDIEISRWFITNLWDMVSHNYDPFSMREAGHLLFNLTPLLICRAALEAVGYEVEK